EDVYPRIGRNVLVEVDHAAGNLEPYPGEREEALPRDHARFATDAGVVGRTAQDDVGTPFAVEAHAIHFDAARRVGVDQEAPGGPRCGARRDVGRKIDLARADGGQLRGAGGTTELPARFVDVEPAGAGSADAIGDDPHRPGDGGTHRRKIHHFGVAHRHPQVHPRAATGGHAGQIDVAAAADAAAVGCSAGEAGQVEARTGEAAAGAHLAQIGAGELALHAQRVPGHRAAHLWVGERAAHVGGHVDLARDVDQVDRGETPQCVRGALEAQLSEEVAGKNPVHEGAVCGHVDPSLQPAAHLSLVLDYRA